MAEAALRVPLCLLAPLSGVTDLHMRRIARRCGADAVISEMVAAREFTRGSGEATLRCMTGRC